MGHIDQKSNVATLESQVASDLTAAGVKTLYETNADTNAFTDAEKTKLAGLSPSAGAPTVVSIAVGDSPYTASWGEDIEVDASGGNVTINIPTAVGNSGETLWVTRIDDTVTTNVIVDPNLSETINGESTITIDNQWTSLAIRSNGTNVGIR